MKILLVLTSHDQLGDTGHKTGFWLEEFASPYYVFKDAGAQLTLASPKGGQPPLDPKSDEADAQTPATERFKSDPAAQQALANTVPLNQVKADDYDAVFYPGGQPLVRGKKVTGFSNSEEAAVQLTEVVPFLVQDMLIANGGHYSSVNDWQSHVKVDGLLITGQNPGSSDATAEALMQLLKTAKA